MSKVQLLQKLVNTKVDSQKSKELFGSIIRKEFDETKDEDRAFELLTLAWKFQIPQLDEMLNDYSLTDFNWF